MKTNTMTISVLLAAALAPLVIAAQAPGNGQSFNRNSQEQGGGGGSGGGSFSILEDLNLTEEQKAKINALTKANQVKLAPANKEYERARDALDKTTENGTDEEILDAAEALSETMKKRSIIRAEYTQAINKTLTPEQRAEKEKKTAEMERQMALRAKERQKRMQAMEARRTSGSQSSSSNSSGGRSSSSNSSGGRSSSSSDIVSITQLELDLTVEQLAKIMTIEKTVQEKQIVADEAVDQARTALRKAAEIGKEEKILDAVKELCTAYGEQAIIKAQVIRETKEILTPEQRVEREKQLAEKEKQRVMREKEIQKRIQEIQAGQTSGSQGSSGGSSSRGSAGGTSRR